MVSDSVISSVTVKDFGKKKRANRSAKLKQCKLDARREQWLSQGAAVKNKGTREEQPPQVAVAAQPACENESKCVNVIGDLDTRRRGRRGRRGEDEEKENNNGSNYHDFDDADSPSNSPTGSCVLSSTDAGTNFTGSSSSSSSSSSCTSSGGCCSGSITEEEEEADDDCLDDWEAVADALAANDESKKENHNDNPCTESESSSQLESDTNLINSGAGGDDLRQDANRTSPLGLAPGNSRAWRSDDAFRPQSLPNLSKQRSFPNADRRYGHGGGGLPWCYSNVVNVPSSCPICCEELDGTDTSFLPCICGFRLCLFCYNRIRQADGRCPSCRKNYEDNPVESELSDNGGCMTFRLPRSYSMVARSS